MRSHMRYHRPASLAQACELLRELGPEASVLAGGTDVLVDLRRGSKQPTHLVSLASLHELRRVQVLDGELKIGALATPAALESSPEACSARPELLDVVRVFGSPQVRFRATVGGNLCTAASCGDMTPLLMVLGARVSLQGPEGRRDLTLEQLFPYHRETALRPGEILVEVAVPVRGRGEGAAYQAFGSRATNFITAAGVAAFLRVVDGICLEARIALGAVAPTPVLVPAAAEPLLGSSLDEESLRDAASMARAAAAPISDVRGSAGHRRELVEVLCRRALAQARGRAGGAFDGAPGPGEVQP